MLASVLQVDIQYIKVFENLPDANTVIAKRIFCYIILTTENARVNIEDSNNKTMGVNLLAERTLII